METKTFTYGGYTFEPRGQFKDYGIKPGKDEFKEISCKLDSSGYGLEAIGENIRREGQVYQAELEERQRLGLHGEDAIRHYNEWMKKYGMEHLMVKEG